MHSALQGLTIKVCNDEGIDVLIPNRRTRQQKRGKLERENPAKPPERDSDEVVTINILLKDTLKVMEDNHMMIEMFGDKMKSFSSFDFKGIPGIGSLNESVNKIMDMRTNSLDAMWTS